MLDCDVLNLYSYIDFFIIKKVVQEEKNQIKIKHKLSAKTSPNVTTSFRHSKNECARTFDVKETLCYYYTEPLYQALKSICSVKQLSIKTGKSEKLFQTWGYFEGK